MEVIKLKSRRKIKWKNIIFILLIISFLIFVFNFKISYKYILIDEELNKTSLGYSQSNNLINETINNYTQQIMDKGYLISDFNMTKIIKIKMVIIPKKIKTNDDYIKQEIKKSVYVQVYAAILSKEDEIIYVYYDTGQILYNKLTKKQQEQIIMSYGYVNIQEIANQEQIDAFITNEN